MTRFTLFCFLILATLRAGDMEDRVRYARDQVFPALVHIQPVKEILISGEKQKMQVTGSGVIISPDGYVVTNNHVAEKARFVRCTLSSREELTARVIGLDPWTDLAVLKLDLEAAGLRRVPYARFGNSNKTEVGQVVIALGSPLGLSRSLSMGVISSVDRYFEDMGDMVSPFNLWLQTDAAINPGNSGGPLVNLDGRIIGINARAVTFGENLGFAIPADIVQFVIRQIIDHGEVERSYVGIHWQEIKDFRRYRKTPDMRGALVADVEADSPADSAGIRPGDVVTAINHSPVNAVYREELPALRLRIANVPVGSRLPMHIQRGDSVFSVQLVTGRHGKFQGTEFNAKTWGMTVEEITPRIKRQLQLKDARGVIVSGVKIPGPAFKGDIRRGDIILRINGAVISDVQHFRKRYQKALRDSERGVLLMVQTENSKRFALIEGVPAQ